MLVPATYADDDSAFPALRAGALGRLTKDADDEVGAAIRAVHRGRSRLGPRGPGTPRRPGPVAGGPAGHPAPGRGRGGGVLPEGLTPREAEVLTLIARGLSYAEICDRLVVSRATVETHINRNFAKR
ncbi:LuxR C-terminal-related transcriptional regulator [Streptomyces sp. NPDC047706]|uniref:response regulator transcription factor n=1 Tax=Streptomyces sp. NPDC047706 TaxID=3365486 RepID=UPI00371E6EFA